MTGLYEYVIHVDGHFNDKVETKSGVEIFVDRRMSFEKSANRVGTIISTPLFYDSILKAGYEVMFDPTLVYRPIYKSIEKDSPYLINSEKSLFKATASLIVLYREDSVSEWKGFGDNLIVKKIKEETEEAKSSILYIPESSSVKYKNWLAKIVFPNSEVINSGLSAGDNIYYSPKAGIPFDIEGIEMLWIRSKDVYGKQELN